MRLRGLRSIDPVCLVLCGIYIIWGVIIIFIISLIYTIIVYNIFIRSYPFSTVPFWKDNRTTSKKALLPVLKVEDIKLKNATIVIAACCRNVKKKFSGFQRNVEAIAALFGDYRIYLCESDSGDGTLKLLNEWQKNDSAHIRVHSKGRQQHIYSRKFI
jgi:hypothetical protein